MTPSHAVDRFDQPSAPLIGIIVFDGVDDLDFVGIASVLRKAALCASPDNNFPSCILIPTTDAIVVTTAGGLKIDQLACRTAVTQCRALVFPGGEAAQRCEMTPQFVTAVDKAARDGALLCSICSGAFLLARMGLLARRRVALHARHIDAMGDIDHCLGDQGFVKDGAIWSVGGVLESGYPKSVAMGIALLEHFWPSVVDTVLARIELPKRPVTGSRQAR